MNLKAPGFSKKAMTILAMLMFIGAGYAYYFFGYVKTNEVDYHQKAFRVLHQIGTNIDHKK